MRKSPLLIPILYNRFFSLARKKKKEREREVALFKSAFGKLSRIRKRVLEMREKKSFVFTGLGLLSTNVVKWPFSPPSLSRPGRHLV
jgi:hypothetical protein